MSGKKIKKILLPWLNYLLNPSDAMNPSDGFSCSFMQLLTGNLQAVRPLVAVRRILLMNLKYFSGEINDLQL